jgi:hypothetical protein
LFYIAFTSKFNYFYYLCSASLNLKSVDYQDEVVQKELKEDLYNKTDYFKVKYEEILDNNDSRAYYGVMWR